MAKLQLMVEAEYENIERTLAKLPPSSKLPYLSEMELAGVATFLHNIYNGIENILKQCLLSKNIKIPRTESWHKELLEQAVFQRIIPDNLKTSLREYLLFRHFFTHAYSLDLYADRMERLVDNIGPAYKQFKSKIYQFIKDKSF